MSNLPGETESRIQPAQSPTSPRAREAEARGISHDEARRMLHEDSSGCGESHPLWAYIGQQVETERLVRRLCDLAEQQKNYPRQRELARAILDRIGR